MSGYLDYSGRDDVLGGGARMIPVSTPLGTYRVWVKRVGNNPRLGGAAAARGARGHA
jgi:proline iminopeptidase